MKKIALLSLISLLPFYAQAMEMPGSLPVYFRYYTPDIPALHNKITMVFVDQGNTLAHAVTVFKTKNNIAAGTPFILVFDAATIDENRSAHLNIVERRRGQASIKQGSFPDPIGINNPINITFPMGLPRVN